MRKASMILGIVGGVIAILVALFAIAGGIFFRASYPSIIDLQSDYYEEEGINVDDFTENGSKFASNMFIILGSLIFMGGVLGIVGGALVKKNNIVAAVLMFIASVITLFTVWSILSFILFLLGGIFALVKDTPVVQPQVQNNL